MTTFTLKLDPLALHELRGLPPEAKRAVREALRALQEDPTGKARLLDVKDLEIGGRETPLCRLRVGRWRVAFEVRGRDIIVLRVFSREEGYRWLETFGL